MGKRRQVVIEVVTGTERDGGHLACCGFGTGAAWYRNILATPRVSIQVGNRRMIAVAEPLDDGRAAR